MFSTLWSYSFLIYAQRQYSHIVWGSPSYFRFNYLFAHLPFVNLLSVRSSDFCSNPLHSRGFLFIPIYRVSDICRTYRERFILSVSQCCVNVRDKCFVLYLILSWMQWQTRNIWTVLDFIITLRFFMLLPSSRLRRQRFTVVKKNLYMLHTNYSDGY